MKLSSGREIKANLGIIGISDIEDRNTDIYHGYDGFIHNQCDEDWENPEEFDFLTKKERIEIADYMIQLWKKYKDNATKERETI